MSWLKVDDQFCEHPKVLAVGPLAAWLHTCALNYCARHLTDGFLPRAKVATLADFSGIDFEGLPVEVGRLVKALLTARGDRGALWSEVDGGYQIHDYLDFNPSRAEIESEKAEARDRMQRMRNRMRARAQQREGGATDQELAAPGDNGRGSSGNNGRTSGNGDGARAADVTPSVTANVTPLVRPLFTFPVPVPVPVPDPIPDPDPKRTKTLSDSSDRAGPSEKSENGKIRAQQRTAVMDHYYKRSGRSPSRYRLVPERVRILNRRLDEIERNLECCEPEKLICYAIDRLFESPHHLGQNDRSTEYLDLFKHVLKDYQQVERWINTKPRNP